MASLPITKQETHVGNGLVSDTEKSVAHKSDTADAALAYVGDESVAQMTEIDEKALVRKIDWMILPLMWACYNLQYLDKTLINYANVMGIQEDTQMVGDQFSYMALVFYVTYLAFELPTGYLMQRLPLAKYLGFNVAAWGLMTACTCAAKNFAALVTLRAFLGCFESAVAPGLMLVTTMWYKKKEQPLRVGFWFVGTGTGNVIGALTSFGFQHYGGSGFSSWQIMFLVFGLITVAVGIAVMVFMPDNPMSSKLTYEEKVWAVERLRENQTGVENKQFKWYQAIECLRDPQTWLLCLIVISSTVPNGAVSSFQAAIIKSFGYTSKETALLSIPSGVVSAIAVIGATWCAGRWNLRGIFVIALLAPGLLGGCLLSFLPSDRKIGLLIGNYLTLCIGQSLGLIYSWVGANYAGHTKKVTMNAILLMSFCLGNIIGPLTFKKEDAPGYLPAKITIVVTVAVAIGFTLILLGYYKWENDRRDRRATSITLQGNGDFLDLTDMEIPNFRYQH
ncbi:unnamed protein product [Clonostachys solani]|uniref:Major facilitator superfamily (MFS) profile domain-containing protein n=1 Tax=Clonostachys solani TaxID=160281 RepID=A0A9N9Z1D9_9HYPO|nr:unnamed protein product [Clonostachys solani]